MAAFVSKSLSSWTAPSLRYSSASSSLESNRAREPFWFHCSMTQKRCIITHSQRRGWNVAAIAFKLPLKIVPVTSLLL